ncbi:hypothetical protein KR093_009661 [Drosophila rubida]|uniref:Uncharacterized protein n=1 Tax=Drosophila rubida TaxID=30044 RepID=A0AAD4JRG3_9MUSC|nr:hypothetical protein KR093_009661 [Drosophila rubida]
MARLSLIVLALVALLSCANALLTEAVIVSVVLLNTILGGNLMDMVVAGAVEKAGALSYYVNSLTNGAPKAAAYNVAPAVVRHIRRRREALEDSNPNDEQSSDEAAAGAASTDETILALQEDINISIQKILQDMAGEASVHLGLPVHTLEAIFNGEKDAPNYEDVVDTVAKRFNLPNYVLYGLHNIFDRAQKYEEDYENGNAEQ